MSYSVDISTEAVRLALGDRIYNLVQRGALICESYVYADEAAAPSCKRCGYRDDVHLLRDALKALTALSARRDALEQELKMRQEQDDTRVDGQPVSEGLPTAASNEVIRAGR